MARNELTSARISRLAGRILRALKEVPRGSAPTVYVHYYIYPKWKGMRYPHCVMVPLSESDLSVDDLKALAASALTQAADKPKSKRTKNVKKRSK